MLPQETSRVPPPVTENSINRMHFPPANEASSRTGNEDVKVKEDGAAATDVEAASGLQKVPRSKVGKQRNTGSSSSAGWVAVQPAALNGPTAEPESVDIEVER